MIDVVLKLILDVAVVVSGFVLINVLNRLDRIEKRIINLENPASKEQPKKQMFLSPEH